MKTDQKRGRKTTPKTRKPGIESNARKRKQGGNGRPFEKGHTFGFKPGQSGNPGGRPKAISEAYKEWLEKETPDGRTNAMVIAERVGGLAVAGKLDAVIEMREATEGKAVQPIVAAPDMSDAKQRLAHLVASVIDRSKASDVAGVAQ